MTKVQVWWCRLLFMTYLCIPLYRYFDSVVSVTASFNKADNQIYWGGRIERKFHRMLNMKKRGIRIHVVGDVGTINDHCWEPGCLDDNGKPFKKGQSRACTANNGDGSKDIWIKSDDEDVVMLHELCHADGSYTPSQCEEMFP